MLHEKEFHNSFQDCISFLIHYYYIVNNLKKGVTMSKNIILSSTKWLWYATANGLISAVISQVMPIVHFSLTTLT